MKKKTKSVSFLLFFIFVVMQIPFSVVSAQEGNTIQVISSDVENNFPDSLTFHIFVQSEKPITRIKLYYRLQGDISPQSQPLDFDPAESVNTSYTWDTSKITVAPSAPIIYYWQILDEEGNRLTTPETLVYYDDLRFAWKELSSSEITLRWYEGDDEFGETVFRTAELALEQMKEQTDQELDFPVFILLYANEEDFESWHYFVQDWVGGQAFSALGITAQIVPPATSSAWINDVIPHEIAHLFFYQIIKANVNSWPTWLNEGFAQYYEFSSNAEAITRVASAAQKGEIIPLALISGSFGSDPDYVYLAYDESYTVVLYIVDTWGYEGVQDLITNFREGKNYRSAIEDAFGVTWEEFEAGWITWLGVPTTPAPQPTPTSTRVYMTAPAGWPTPTKAQTNISTNTPPATDMSEIGTATAVPAPTKPSEEVKKKPALLVICAGGTLVIFASLTFLVVLFILVRQIKNRE